MPSLQWAIQGEAEQLGKRQVWTAMMDLTANGDYSSLMLR